MNGSVKRQSEPGQSRSKVVYTLLVAVWHQTDRRREIADQGARISSYQPFGARGAIKKRRKQLMVHRAGVNRIDIVQMWR